MTAAVASPAAPPLLVRGVGKQFGATHALRDVTFEVRRGEVHALLGHNGCGKSTLVKIISGFQAADSGSITMGGLDGAGARVGIVHQDLGLCRSATVVENCGMGSFQRRLGMINWKQERRVVAEILTSLGADFGLDDIVADLSPADKAITAIARALKASGGVEGLDLLVLDEATAALRGPDAEKVLSAARAVAAHGGGVLLVTHHMSEVLADADRATVLASGRVVDTVDVAGVTEDDLLRLIGGGKVPPKVGPSGRQASIGDEVLTVRSLTGAAVHDLDFAVRPGEIVGLTGAAGAGHDEVPYLLCGVTKRSVGSIGVAGEPYTGRSVREAQQSGLGVLPADRLRQGIVPRASVRENLSPASRASHRTGGVLRVQREKAWARDICADYAVMPPDPELPMSALSGGNQQKVLFARVLEHDPRVLVLHEPTQGVDENTRRALLRRVRDLVDEGLGVLYVSSDAEEVAECADRVLVMRRGALVGELPAGLDHIDEIYAACYAAGDRNAAAPTREENDR
ncbi:sugar ABC transporter ATP-binding protein [Blastococcus saxobsidens]|uniref:Sugar ABC transporter n=1 Tax=Blastococcus saxobsidens (strain DD2) TaxID=1146883 RepID=H6RQK8_BLASD|nr:sugar ABC transporter ATP-binding protein [Blastococcus saxobsidens]CCG05376.1 Sugar ABC transporter [Blastococcus saxobsidens DD2]